MSNGVMFTVGHSTHTEDRFVSLLKRHDISVVADVRSSPFSRFNPQFNRDSLKKSLKENRIKYVFMGNTLGARTDDASCYVDGQVKYSRLARTARFQEGIERLIKGVEDHRIALMCAEREPLECHRTLLVSQALVAKGLSIQHIHSDGSLERHENALERLLDVLGLPHEDLFRSKAEFLAEALAQQEDRIAYQDANQNQNESGAAQ